MATGSRPFHFLLSSRFLHSPMFSSILADVRRVWFCRSSHSQVPESSVLTLGMTRRSASFRDNLLGWDHFTFSPGSSGAPVVQDRLSGLPEINFGPGKGMTREEEEWKSLLLETPTCCKQNDKCSFSNKTAFMFDIQNQTLISCCSHLNNIRNEKLSQTKSTCLAIRISLFFF